MRNECTLRIMWLCLSLFPSSILTFGLETPIKSRLKPKCLFQKMPTQNVCSWNKFGFCKHREFCRKYHEKKLCETQACDILNCLLRHPKKCKFYTEYKRCKFDPCAYKHIDSDINDDMIENMRKENKALLNQLEQVRMDLDVLAVKERESEETINRLIAVEEKVNNIEKNSDKIIDLENMLKDSTLKAFEQEKNIKMMNKKVGVLKERETRYTELQEKYDDLVKKVNEM